MTSEIRARTLDWGTGWASVPDGGALQRELDRELAAQHPLSTTKPVVFGRCLACDDKVTADGVAWPYFQRLTFDSFVARFVRDRKSTRLNSSHSQISYAVFCLKKKKQH